MGLRLSNTDPWSEVEEARLFYLVAIEGDLIVNLQTEEGFRRVRINSDQAAGALLELVNFLLEERKK